MQRAILITVLVTIIAAQAPADGVKTVTVTPIGTPAATYAAGDTPDDPARVWTIATPPIHDVTASWWAHNERSQTWTRVWPPMTARSDSVVTIAGGDVYRQTIPTGTARARS